MAEHTQHCPNCKQNMVVYRRQMRPNMLFCLSRLYEKFGQKAVKVIDIDERANAVADFPKLRFWGLIEEETPSHYAITGKGIDFIKNDVSVPKFKWVYLDVVQPDPAGIENPLVFAKEIGGAYISKQTAVQQATNKRDFIPMDERTLFNW